MIKKNDISFNKMENLWKIYGEKNGKFFIYGKFMGIGFSSMLKKEIFFFNSVILEYTAKVIESLVIFLNH